MQASRAPRKHTGSRGLALCCGNDASTSCLSFGISLREYVERYPDIYARVLSCPPGVTGLATLRFNQREAQLLASCASAKETDRVYCRRCIPTKARLDLAYQKHASMQLDLWILWRTLRQIVARSDRVHLPG